MDGMRDGGMDGEWMIEFQPSAQCVLGACDMVQTLVRGPSRSGAPVWTSWPAPPLTPCEMSQSAVTGTRVGYWTLCHYQSSTPTTRGKTTWTSAGPVSDTSKEKEREGKMVPEPTAAMVAAALGQQQSCREERKVDSL